MLKKNLTLCILATLVSAIAVAAAAARTPVCVPEPAVSAHSSAAATDCPSQKSEPALVERVKARAQTAREKCPGVECGEMPFGASVKAHMNMQIANAKAASAMLYEYDFCDTPANADKLNAHGFKRLEEIARGMQGCCPQTLVIERTAGNRALDAARRQYVLKVLDQLDALLPEDLVVIGDAETRGLNGADALKIQEGLMEQTERGGAKSIKIDPSWDYQQRWGQRQ
jgi:hypothetical protein